MYHLEYIRILLMISILLFYINKKQERKNFNP
jgi:hypothetical protein